MSKLPNLASNAGNVFKEARDARGATWLPVSAVPGAPITPKADCREAIDATRVKCRRTARVSFKHDPQTGVALGSSPGPQCAFEMSMLMCPAVHTTTRSLLRLSSTHEPSDPPLRVVHSVYDTNVLNCQIRCTQYAAERGTGRSL